MSSPTPSAEPTAAREAIARAIAERAATNPHESLEEIQYAQERDKRIYFRRLVDPGIARGTQPTQYEATLQMLLKLASNILQEPENEKYHRFKPTNIQIRKNIVDVKGGLEYAVEMGFRAEVENFQPYYVFHPSPKKHDNLRIGASVLEETLDQVEKAREQAKLNRVDPKAVTREVALKVKMQYEDDRKEKKRRDEMDRQAREARAARFAAEATASRNGQQRNPGAASPAPDDDESMTILPVREREEGADDLAEQSPSPEAPAGVGNNDPTSANQPGTPPQVSLHLA